MIPLLVLLPILSAAISLVLPWTALRRTLLVLTAFSHLGLVAAVAVVRPGPALYGLLRVDGLGLVTLLTTSFLFAVVSLYTTGYLAREPVSPRRDVVEDLWSVNEPERVFLACLLLFLASMTLVALSQHFGMLWTAIEATTLASAPLIYFHRHRRSLEATWKYVLICSVGIGLALLGNLFLGVAGGDGEIVPLTVRDLVARGSALNPLWLKGAFVFLLVGYGTKMGLAPMHTWLPDAHSEAPSVVSALLSGALLNCAFLGILRAQQVLNAAGLADFGSELLLVFGLLSMAVAAVFVIRQPDYKRLLAYSSIEHMGVLAVGVGLGGGAIFGAMLHAMNHSVAKALLFLGSGNLLRVYRSKTVASVRGALKTVPLTATLWLLGFLAISGIPPFGTFLSEFLILRGGIAEGWPLLSAAYLALLGVIFVGMASAVLGMIQGEAVPGIERAREPLSSILPLVLLVAASLCLGLWLPTGLARILTESASLLGGGP